MGYGTSFALSFSTMTNSSRSYERGFTLVELLITLALSTVLLLLGLPALQNMMFRARLEGSVRETAMMMSQARMEAIKRNRRTLVQVNDEGEPKETLVAYVDVGTTDFELDTDDEVLGRLRLPMRIDWRNPGGQEGLLADTFPQVSGTSIDADGPIFQPDGSALDVGALRIADDRDNFLEVMVSPAGTGKISIRKYSELDSAWHEAGDEGKPWDWK